MVLKDSLKEESKKKIREIEKKIQDLPMIPTTFTYIKVYQALQELHFHEKYEIVNRICDACRDIK